MLLSSSALWLLAVPSLAHAATADGAIFYTDETITISQDTGGGDPSLYTRCYIRVVGPDGPRDTQVMAYPGHGCGVISVSVGPGPAGTYTWSWAKINGGPLGPLVGEDIPGGSFTVVVRPPDTVAPTVPNGLRVSGSSDTLIAIGWNGSTDDRRVAGYSVYRDGVKVGNVEGDSAPSSWNIDGLACGMSYTFSVDAYDGVGNRSAKASIVASTRTCSSVPPSPQPTPPPPAAPAPPPTPQPPAPPLTPTPQPNPTPHPQPGPGSRLAKVWAFKSTGRVGGVARIRVATEVGATYSRYVVKVMGKRGVVATIKAPVVKRGLVQIVSWRVPKSVKVGSLRFSVQALGATKSATAYAPLVLKKQA